MRKFMTSIALGMLLLLLWGCTYTDPVIASLPEYREKALYLEDGFQDYTNYGIYTYDPVDVAALRENAYLAPVTDVADVRTYIGDFEKWVEIHRENNSHPELVAAYAFDPAIIDSGDYVCIQTREGHSKFDSYTVYFFDVDTNRLYYFHNNI